jgi:hypothetical protein
MLDEFDTSPLAVIATESRRSTATAFQRLFGMRRQTAIYRCTCPACGAAFELPARFPTQPSACPACRRALRVCAVTQGS